MTLRDIFNKRKAAEDQARSLMSKADRTADDVTQANLLLDEALRWDKEFDAQRKLDELDSKEAGKEVINNDTANEGRDMVALNGHKATEYGKNDKIKVIRDDADKVPLGALLRSICMKPVTDAEKRALVGVTDSAGGYSVNAFIFSDFVDSLRSNSVIFKAGAKLLDLQAGTGESFSYAKIATNPTTIWRANQTTEITESSPTLGQVLLTPFTCGSLVTASKELLQDSLNIDQIIQTMFVKTFATEIDRVALAGVGTTEPLGIVNYPSLGVTYDMSAAFEQDTATSAYFAILKTIAALKGGNAAPNAIILSPELLLEMSALTDNSGQYLQLPPVLQAMQWLDTTLIEVTDPPTPETSIVVGNFEELVVGLRRQVTIQPLDQRYAEYYKIGFISAMRLDVQPLHSESFGLIDNVLIGNSWT